MKSKLLLIVSMLVGLAFMFRRECCPVAHLGIVLRAVAPRSVLMKRVAEGQCSQRFAREQ